jgi:hypothetical protein
MPVKSGWNALPCWGRDDPHEQPVDHARQEAVPERRRAHPERGRSHPEPQLRSSAPEIEAGPTAALIGPEHIVRQIGEMVATTLASKSWLLATVRTTRPQEWRTLPSWPSRHRPLRTKTSSRGRNPRISAIDLNPAAGPPSPSLRSLTNPAACAPHSGCCPGPSDGGLDF